MEIDAVFFVAVAAEFAFIMGKNAFFPRLIFSAVLPKLAQHLLIALHTVI